MDGKVFSSATDALLKDWIGGAIKPRIPFLLRGLVKPVIGIAINIFNTQADKIVPDRVDVYINGAINEINKGNYDMAGQFVGKGLDALAEKLKGGSLKEKFFTNIGITIMSGIEYTIELRKAS